MTTYINYAADVRQMEFNDDSTIVVTEKGAFDLPGISAEEDGQVLFYIDENGLWVQPSLLVKLLEVDWDKAFVRREHAKEVVAIYHRELCALRSHIAQLVSEYDLDLPAHRSLAVKA